VIFSDTGQEKPSAPKGAGDVGDARPEGELGEEVGAPGDELAFQVPAVDAPSLGVPRPRHHIVVALPLYAAAAVMSVDAPVLRMAHRMNSAINLGCAGA
jgi:hypothetical protein